MLFIYTVKVFFIGGLWCSKVIIWSKTYDKLTDLWQGYLLHYTQFNIFHSKFSIINVFHFPRQVKIAGQIYIQSRLYSTMTSTCYDNIPRSMIIYIKIIYGDVSGETAFYPKAVGCYKSTAFELDSREKEAICIAVGRWRASGGKKNERQTRDDDSGGFDHSSRNRIPLLRSLGHSVFGKGTGTTTAHPPVGPVRATFKTFLSL